MAKSQDIIDKRGKRRNINLAKVMRWLKNHTQRKKASKRNVK